MNPNQHGYQDDQQAQSPAIGHYEDLLAFQRQTIDKQSKVIDELTTTIERLRRAFTATDGVVDAEIQEF